MFLLCLQRILFESFKDETDLYQFTVQKRMNAEIIDNYLMIQNKPIKKSKCTLELGIFGITIR